MADAGWSDGTGARVFPGESRVPSSVIRPSPSAIRHPPFAIPLRRNVGCRADGLRAGELALPRPPPRGTSSRRPAPRHAPPAGEGKDAHWVNPSPAIPDHEEFRPPRAIRLALPGPVRAVAGLRGDGRLALELQHQRGPAPAEDPLLQRELPE